nr:ArsC/Spx/MgsR family protein [Falsirhodobacter sp. alg1]
MTVYGIKTCDTCRKAVKALSDQNAVLHDIRAEPLSAAEWQGLLDKFGDSLVNRKSTTWRSLSETDRAAPALDLLMAHPSLMKRPVIKQGDKLYMGWSEETRTALSV